MSVLTRASLGYLRRHPWQLAQAILGICIGVAVMVAVDLANQSSRNAFVASMDTINGDATHQIVGGPGGIDEALYTQLRVRAGIRSIAPIVTGSVLVADRNVQLLGVDVFAEREFRTFSSRVTAASGENARGGNDVETLIRDMLGGSGQVLIAADSVAELEVVVGDKFSLVADGISHTATFAGIPGGEATQQMSGLMVADISDAQRWLNMAGKLSRIDVKVAAGDEDLLSRIRTELPSGIELLSAAGRTQTTAAMSDAFMTNLFAMSLLALLVGVFLIYNSVAFIVLQRRPLIGVLRALGVTQRQIYRLILGEAAVLGFLGALLGVVLGVWLGEKLLVMVARTLSDHYFAVNVTDVSIASMTILKGFIAGLGATIVAAAVPAIEASSYQPSLALTRSVLESKVSSNLSRLCWAGVLFVAVAVLILWLSGRSLGAGLSALFLLILGFALGIPLFVQYMSRALERPAFVLAGTAGRLAVGSVGKSLSRTGIAVIALTIAVSATVGVSVMVESFRGSVSDWLNTTLQSDVYVGVRRGSLDPALMEELIAIPGIAGYSSSRRAWLEDSAGRTRIIATQSNANAPANVRIRDGDPDLAWRELRSGNAVFVSDAYAYRFDVGRGDRVKLNTSTGEVAFEIAAVFQNYDSNDGAILISRDVYIRYFDDPQTDSLGLYLEPGVGAPEIMEKLRAVAAGRQALIMNSNAKIREFSLQIFDRTFVITNVLYWLAVVVAVIGIFGAMMALQLERTKEIGILRALGMTPGQVGVLVSVQTGFIGLLSGVAAIPLGLMMAWVLIEVINRRAFGWNIDFTVPSTVLFTAVMLAVGSALLAGIYPSWYAARSRPALAMRDE
jgi:putative ABC transport system permease protein